MLLMQLMDIVESKVVLELVSCIQASTVTRCAESQVVTTMGVGELSALNGIAGAYTEQVKVIHIVGTTPKIAQENRLMIHHSLGHSPDHRVSCHC